MSRINHGLIILTLLALNSGFLGWKSSRMAILYADGLRYISQAQLLDRGSLIEGIFRSVDHPVYPATIALAHRIIGGTQPEDWQAAAQFASVLCGILLVIPLYLVATDLFGGRVAWISVSLTFLVPVIPNVLGDALSEGPFLLFWSFGLWSALRFLRHGHLAWLAATIPLSALAYGTRPEGLLLPAALASTLAFMPLLRGIPMNWPRWWAAMAFMVLGPLLVVGPYIATKGGLGTKPAIARILGTAPRSSADAVERNRPLGESESLARTYAVAAKQAFEAVRDASTIPLLALGLLGLAAARLHERAPRQALLLATLLAGCFLGLVRLHATGGYCSPRHALIPALILLSAAGLGLDAALSAIAIPGRWLGQPSQTLRPGPLFWLLAVAGLGASNLGSLTEPINHNYAAYRHAAGWLEQHAKADDRIVDLTGWTQFYSSRQGYVFSDAILAGADQQARWVVAREAHLAGPWDYCRILRNLVGPLSPVASFPPRPAHGEARVLVFDRRLPGQLALMGTPEPSSLR